MAESQEAKRTGDGLDASLMKCLRSESCTDLALEGLGVGKVSSGNLKTIRFTIIGSGMLTIGANH